MIYALAVALVVVGLFLLYLAFRWLIGTGGTHG